MRESGYFTNRCLDALERALPGSDWTKRPGGRFAAAGVPDLLGCVPATSAADFAFNPLTALWDGLYVAVELKRPGGGKGLSAVQRRRMARTVAAGGIAVSGDSPIAVVAAVLEAIAAKGWTPHPA